MGIVERLAPDELWELFQRVAPEAPTRPQGGGRRRHGDREVLAAIVFVATSGCTWQQLPAASFGPSGATAHRRFTEWTKARVWAKLHRLVLDELGSRGNLDWSRCQPRTFRGSVPVPAAPGAALFMAADGFDSGRIFNGDVCVVHHRQTGYGVVGVQAVPDGLKAMHSAVPLGLRVL